MPSRGVYRRIIRICLKCLACQGDVIFVNIGLGKTLLLTDHCKRWRSNAMNIPMELSLEQRFNLKVYEEQVKGLSPEESRQFLLEVLRQLMVKDNMLKHLMKHQAVG